MLSCPAVVVGEDAQQRPRKIELLKNAFKPPINFYIVRSISYVTRTVILSLLFGVGGHTLVKHNYLLK